MFSKQVEADKLSVHRGDPPPPVSLQSYAEQWLAGLQRNTAHAYGSALRNHVLPLHGHRALGGEDQTEDGVGPGSTEQELTAFGVTWIAEYLNVA